MLNGKFSLNSHLKNSKLGPKKTSKEHMYFILMIPPSLPLSLIYGFVPTLCSVILMRPPLNRWISQYYELSQLNLLPFNYISCNSNWK